MKTYVLLNHSKKLNALTQILTLSLVFFASTLIAQPKATNIDVGVLAFDEETIDYGTIAQHEDGVRTFKFKNRGRAPIVISKVKTTCGCTVPTYSKAPILPGESGSIDIKYDTKRLGAFTKTITVMSNASEGVKKIKIKGNILASETNNN